MFLPVNRKTMAASVFVLIAIMAAGRLPPTGFIRRELVVWIFGLAVLYALYNLAASLLIWLIDNGLGFIVQKFINPEVGRAQHEIMGGQAVHESVYYKDGTEKHYFHYDPRQVVFTGGGQSNNQDE